MSLLGPEIQGVEVTQAIQYYRSSAHLTDEADWQPDNSVTLVANKPAWVRVYVRAGVLSIGLRRVTGTLTIRRRIFGWLWSILLGSVAPEPPGSIMIHRTLDYVTERSNLGYTLNFIIPASMMCGHLRLDVRVRSRFFFFFRLTRRYRVRVDATLRQTLRLAGIMVGYDGPVNTTPGAPNITLPAPTLVDLQATSAWTLLSFPVSSMATYRIAGTITWDQPLTDAPSCSGCCTPNWVALNAAVQAVRVADGNRTDVLYYGLLATGIPMGPIVGCNSGGVSTGSVGAGVTMAHELGHACGRPHSPCGTPGDTGYPAYEPYDPVGTPTASIGEYGLDISAGTVMPPNVFRDFMSYCGPKWISLYVMGRLTNNAALDPRRACVDWPWFADVVQYEGTLMPEKWLPDPPPDPDWLHREVRLEALISLIGVQHGPEEIEMKSVLRLETQGAVPNGRLLDLRAELLDDRGNIIASSGVYGLRSFADAGCCGESAIAGNPYPRLIQAFVKDVAPGTVIRVRRNEKEVWSRRAPSKPPTVDDFTMDLVGDDVRLSWFFESSTDWEPEAVVQVSADGGRSWSAFSAGLRGRSARLDARGLPAGSLLFRLLVSDGFSTAMSPPVTITVPPGPTQVTILSPRQGRTMTHPGSLRLWAIATTTRGDSVSEVDAKWFIDEQMIATGMDVYVKTPSPGDHRATITVIGREGSVSRSAEFTVKELPVERDAKDRRDTEGQVKPME